MTQAVALITLSIYIAMLIGISVYTSRSTRTMDGFLLGNRNIGPWMSAFSYGTSYFSAVIFIGYAGMLGWDIGVGCMWIGVGNAFVGCMLAWILLAKPTRRMTHRIGASTMPALFEKRFKSRSMKIYAAVNIYIFGALCCRSIQRSWFIVFGRVSRIARMGCNASCGAADIDRAFYGRI